MGSHVYNSPSPVARRQDEEANRTPVGGMQFRREIQMDRRRREWVAALPSAPLLPAHAPTAMCSTATVAFLGARRLAGPSRWSGNLKRGHVFAKYTLK